MDDKSEKGITLGDVQALDLSGLEGMALGPAWSDADSTSNIKNFSKRAENRSGRSAQSTASRRDRRPRLTSRVVKRAETKSPFQPIAEVIFYPDDTAFKSLVKAIRGSNKTYDLFDITRLILAKPDRFVAMIRPTSNKEENSNHFYVALADGCPFENEVKAFDHCFENFIDQYFTIETVTIDPPKGNFVMINRCSITKELLGPPNYHRYQEFIEQHHAGRLANMAFETFVSKIETVKDPEVIEEWLKKMTGQTRYVLKDTDNSSEPLSFDNSKEARKYLYENKIETMVKSISSLRVPGKLFSVMPDQNLIRRSIEFHLETQRRFPLETANHLRGRLRRLKVNVYKMSSRGISYICAVKRKFRIEGQILADSVQSLIDYIVNNSRSKVSDLEESFLGIEKKDTVVDISTSDENKDTESNDLSPEDKVRVHLMRQDLFWLISEGYVVEYEDGNLYASPAKPEVKTPTITKAKATERADKLPAKTNVVSDAEPGSAPEVTSCSNSMPSEVSDQELKSESTVIEETSNAISATEKESGDKEKLSIFSGSAEISEPDDQGNIEHSS